MALNDELGQGNEPVESGKIGQKLRRNGQERVQEGEGGAQGHGSGGFGSKGVMAIC